MHTLYSVPDFDFIAQVLERMVYTVSRWLLLYPTGKQLPSPSSNAKYNGCSLYLITLWHVILMIPPFLRPFLGFQDTILS